MQQSDIWVYLKMEIYLPIHRFIGKTDDQTAPGVPYFGALGDGPKEYVSGHGLDDTECTRVPMELVLPKAAATVSLNHQWWFFTSKTSGGSTTIDDKMLEAAMKFNQLNHH